MSLPEKNTCSCCKKFPVGRPTVEGAARRLENLLDVAFEVFVEKGYQRASIAEIARLAGASKQTIYSRFRTKGELFQAVIRRGSDEVHAMYQRVLDPAQPVEATLYSYGRNLIEVIGDPNAKRMFRAIISAGDNFPELADFFWSIISVEGDKVLSDYLTRVRDDGRLQITDTMRAAGYFNGLCIGKLPMIMLLALDSRLSKQDVDDNIREAVRIFLAAHSPANSAPVRL